MSAIGTEHPIGHASVFSLAEGEADPEQTGFNE
jgi:hypothetical protein